MAYCCSQCSFKAQFESALTMHHQLHHESSSSYPDFDTSKIILEKSNTVPRVSPPSSPFSSHKSKSFRLAGRTSSATRLFSNLKARICRSRTLFSHPEESQDSCLNVRDPGSALSECTSKAMKVDSVVSRSSALTTCIEDNRKETFGCHLCSFEADRITVLDRHLLNDHKIGLENLLKLVMAKTKDGLSEDNIQIFGIRQPYYKLQDETFEEGEFIIETVEPKIKIVKHASTNTDNSEKIEDFKVIADEIEKLYKAKQDGEQDGGNFMSKMATLNECMLKFVNSSNTLKKVLNKELDSKVNVHMSGTEPVFNLGLGDRDTPRDWERAHSEKLERSRKYSENSRGEKGKVTAESFYF